MSNRAIDTVRRCKDIRGGIKRLFLAIAFHADDNLENATPSVGQLADDMGVTETYVHTLVNRAKAAGMLKVGYGEGFATRYGKTNRYAILLPEVADSLGVNSTERVNNTAPLSVCLLSSTEINNEDVSKSNRQTDKGATEFTPPNSLPLADPYHLTDADGDDVRGLVQDLAEYDVLGSHVTGWVRRIVERPQWQTEVKDILDYWDDERNSNLKEGWIAAQIKQLAYMSRNTPRRALKILKGGSDRAAPVDEFEAIRKKYGGYTQQQETDYGRAIQ
jgi:hypothetical protein